MSIQLYAQGMYHGKWCTWYLRRLQNRHAEDQQHFSPSVIHTGFVGCPSFDIPQEQVHELVENEFTGPQMAGIVGVSLSSIPQQFGLSGLREYDAISDSDYCSSNQHFPTCGIKARSFAII